MKKFFDININIQEVKVAFYIMPDRGHRGMKNRQSYGLVYMCGADREYTFDNGNRYKTKKGDILFLPKNSGYEIKTEVTGDCYIISFDISGDPELNEFVMRPKNTGEVLRHFENAENMWRTKHDGYYEKTFSEVYEIIYNIKKGASSTYIPKSREAIIKPAVKYIYDHYTEENISIQKLAMICSISEQYLRSIFKTVYGISPLKFINNLKVLRAKELIGYGGYSIHEAACMSGFFDDSYFSREFKKYTGVSPKEYSKN